MENENVETVVDNTLAAPVEDNAVVEEVVEEVAQETAPMSIDDLLGLNAEVDPLFTDDANHKGYRPLHEAIKHLPEDARANLANIRASYTRRTQELAQQRAELDQLRQSVEAEKAALYNGDFARKLDELTSDETKHDVFDEEGMQKEIQRQAAAMLKEMIKPVREELTITQRKNELTQFKLEHPDLTGDSEIKMKTAELLKSREDLRLEDAYWQARGMVLAQREREGRAAVSNARQQSRETLSKTSTGSSIKSKAPKFSNAWESYQWHKANQGS